MLNMDDSNADYLTKYREFIESLLKTTDLNYPLPVNVAKYNIAEFEVTGEILNWCLTYLNERNCPNSLAAPLCCKVLEEILQVVKEDPESCGYRTHEDDFQPLKLMQKTIKKLVDVCVYYSDNAKLSTLLPPPSSTLLDPPVSVCGVKNSRRKMEDRHVAIQDLHALFNIKDCGSASYYAVFDGHNGLDAAAYSCTHVHQYLVESPYYPHNPEMALKEAFKKTDDRFVDKSNKEHLDSGTTALCALLRPNESMLYVAWLGDSQAVLVSQGKAYQLVKPHRPDQPDERLRITDMGGTVLYLGTWRVNGHLAVSRAIGDRKYKPFVVGDPDVRVIPLTGKEEFLILASDGLWDFVPENEAVNTVYNYLQQNKGDVGGIAKQLVQLAKSKCSQDNISVVVVFLSEPEPHKGGRMEASEVEHIWRESYVTKAPNGQFGHDDDDFGPETDVDAVHDVLSSSFPAEAAKAKALVAHSQSMEGLKTDQFFKKKGAGRGKRKNLNGQSTVKYRFSQTTVKPKGREWAPQRIEPSQKEFLKTLPWTYAQALKNPKPIIADTELQTAAWSTSEDRSPSLNKDIIISEVPQILIEPESPESKVLPSIEKPIDAANDASVVDIEIKDWLKVTSDGTGNDVAEAEVDSADDSEEEWDYIPGKNNKKTDKKQQIEAPERTPEQQAEEEDDMSQLNPDAAEFVPVFGGKLDTVLSSSPAKGAEKSLENVKVPKQKEFLDEISTKPAELDDSFGLEFNVSKSSVNGIESVECGNDVSSDDSEEIAATPSSNPFAGDTIQHQMVSDYFSENQNLGFKPFDPMQESIIVLDSSPSPTAPAGSDLYDFLANSDKPDLLSPVDNLSNPNNEQQTSSSGFESESGNEIELGAADKCDLVAGMPDDSIDETPITNQLVEDYPETNPFSGGGSTHDEVLPALQPKLINEGSLFSEEEKTEPEGLPANQLIDSPFEQQIISENDDKIEEIEEPKVTCDNEAPLQPVEQVDLISGTVAAADIIAQDEKLAADIPDFTKGFESDRPQIPNFESISEDVKGQDDLNGLHEAQDIQESVFGDIPKEQGESVLNHFSPVVEDNPKDDSAESDSFEMINHDDEDVKHAAQGINGGFYMEDDHSPDNYKINDLIQHSAEIHAEKPKSFEPDFLEGAFRQEIVAPTIQLSSPGEVESSEQLLGFSDKLEESVDNVVESSEKILEFTEKPLETSDKQIDEVIDTLVDTETSLLPPEVHDFLVSPVESEPEIVKGEISVDSAVLPSEPTLEDTLTKSSFEVETAAPVLEELKHEDIIPTVEDVSNKINEIVEIVENDIVEEVSSPIDAVVDTPIETKHEDIAAPAVDESLPATPSAPLSEDILSNEITGSGLVEEILAPVENEQKLVSVETPEEVSEVIQVDDFHKQNGDIADVSTPPSTPAPGVELDNKDGLIAAAVAAAGVGTVAAAATALSGDAKAAKPDDKSAKKPSAKPDVKSSMKPGVASKAPSKPGTTSVAAKKPAPSSATSKAPLAATKTAAAKPASAAKPAAAKPTSATKPAAPITKTSAAAAPKPKPAATTAAKAPVAKSTVGTTAKPPTPTTKTAPTVSKTAPLAKPKTPTTTAAPLKKPTTTITVTKTTVTSTATKKPEPAKPLVSKAAPAARTTTAAPRPSSASKPAATAAARPSSATKPATRPITSTTTKMPATSATKSVGAAKPAAAKPSTPTATSRTSTAAKPPAPASRTAPATKAAAPPKPKPAAPTVLKKPTAAEKAAKDAAAKNAAGPRGPIRRPTSDKAKSDKEAKPVEKDSVEPPMQEPIISTTNGHVDVIENGVSLSDESPIDVKPCLVVEAQN